MTISIAEEAAILLGETLHAAGALQGGDLSQVLLLRFASGREAIVKNGPAPLVEADMLRAIRAAGVPAPKVLAASDAALVLERLPEGGALGSMGAAELGATLRTLHETCGANYGWPADYAFGAVQIRNRISDDWPRFWAENRLLSETDRLPSSLARRLETLSVRLGEILPASPEASLCHGDLWSGNVMAHQGRLSGLIDPAAYYGHGELDLAMLALFGSIRPAFQEAYGALEPGWQKRRAVYQLWPAIVHLRLFGGGYRGMMEDRLSALRF